MFSRTSISRVIACKQNNEPNLPVTQKKTDNNEKKFIRICLKVT